VASPREIVGQMCGGFLFIRSSPGSKPLILLAPSLG
jgi:hypothetical protein